MARNKEDKPLWMPMYWPQYLADTRHLTAKQHGAYLLLTAEYWLKGGLPTDEKRLARLALMTEAEWRLERPVLIEFFEPGWKHARIEEELANSRRIIARQRNNALAGWSKRRVQGTVVPFPKRSDDDADA